MNHQPKIIVLDDDPTGSQTVHSCLLLMQWDIETLRLGLRDESPIFFVLTNTRSLTPEQATEVTREVCQNLKAALGWENIQQWLIVSRSDSTLRGHYPVETDAIAAELGPFDAHFLTPAFFEGGRVTKNSIHYLIIDGVETPVDQTEFARDSVFGYHHSYLPDYVAEKTQGLIKSDQVERFLLADIRAGSKDRLMQLKDNCCCAVDGEKQADLDRFAADILSAASEGKKFLFRSAASLLTSLANLGPQPIPADEMAKYVREGKPGAIIVGSHVKKTTQQLENLLQDSGVVGIEVDVSHLLEDSATQRETLLGNTLAKVQQVHDSGKTPVVYTSRQELVFDSTGVRLQFGLAVSALLMDIVRGLPKDIGFLISKGGITSNDVLSTGLALRTARLLGQVLAGCSMVRTPADHPQFPDLPVVLFPGNVGDATGLLTVYQRLSQHI
ncbi:MULTISPECIES: four-carbon acid sugar kinase family protein [Planktothricoides]|uniref:Four-carbon acid sugar kinase family protein n=2 Tax=Planktothricoides raciborskii TaxID=132608 RepID=A0AAU8JB19_9CYAN|nr:MULTISPECIES: four-carbon acid sugar kinase family protein [Planktothricoides]KOR34381.1 Hrp-dependent type III effector protein [Planktothricoides sp. SR001]MBD2547088.1 four-carbon acid sugar kinase family protein [Planktothricoides raciborskii FACHB-1370]MBD2585424.1 four-carbon acid sugar kinase family protein [Planktothricoides raciborskii FACHB-1261]